MNLNKNTVLCFLMFLFYSFVSSQETNSTKDTIKSERLDEVVVTGQITPKSVKKSVFEVKVISSKDIEQQAGNNLADLLNQSLNISIIPNASSGKSSVSLFGLDGQYFKILIDNIPIINDEGLGNNTDLTQINLDDIQQIEIVEGSMGVQYGSGAVTGIINIITKKGSKDKWNIKAHLQEETVGNEFGIFDKGRHIQSASISNNISNSLFANFTFNRNDFAGFFNNQKGENHQLNDSLRGHEWTPKEQYNVKALLNYKNKKIRAFYKFEFFDETINRYNSTVRPNLNPSTQTTNPTASDAEFSSIRFVNHLNFYGKIANKVNFDASFSYQQQKRNIESYNYRILTKEKFDVENYEYQSRKALYSKANLNNFFNSEVFKLQLGYEISSINGFASSIVGSFDGNNIKRTLGSYDIFSSAELNLNDNFSLKPGIRTFLSSKFDPQFAASLSAKYNFKNDWQLRTIIGSSPRLPNYDELFTYFVDVSHDVRGNENLAPEKGKSVFVYLKKQFDFEKSSLKSKLSSWYLDVNDRIELIVVDPQTNALKFNNIDSYRNLGFAFNNNFRYNNLKFNLGISVSGISKILDSRAIYNDDYLFSTQANTNISYYIPKWKSNFAFYLKYNGPSYLFVQKQDSNGNSIIERGKQNDYSWIDASFNKKINKNFNLTIGVRNLANVTTVNTTAIEGGAHSGPPNSILLGYGRSYFLKLMYNLNIN